MSTSTYLSSAITTTTGTNELNENERSELDLDHFIRHLVFYEGKYGKEKSYFWPRTTPSANLQHLYRWLVEFEKNNAVELELADFDDYLDFPSYIQIVQDYIQCYRPGDDRKRNLTAIVSLIGFARLYARQLRFRGVELRNESFTQKNLERLVTYTTCTIKKLLRSGLQINWNDFCQELGRYQLAPRQLPFDSQLLLTASLCGCILGICWFAMRSQWTSKS